MRLLAKRPRIVSFEPNHNLASALLRKFGRLPDVTIEPVGLGTDEGVFDLHVPSYRGYLFDGLASFDRDEAMSWLNAQRLARFDKNKLACQTFACTIRRLDSFNLAPFFIKLDVQGFELQALMGGEQTIRAHTPILLIEAPGPDIAEYLQRFGYRTYGYASRRFVQGSSRSQNTFFMTDQKASQITTMLKPYHSQPVPKPAS